jgi:hypothetical protein
MAASPTNTEDPVLHANPEVELPCYLALGAINIHLIHGKTLVVDEQLAIVTRCRLQRNLPLLHFLFRLPFNLGPHNSRVIEAPFRAVATSSHDYQVGRVTTS